jgi:enoyl-CoA hydratase
MKGAGVRVEVEPGGVGLVTLDEPGRRNALDAGMVEGLVAAFDRFEASDEVGAVVVTGAPPAFCAGANLADLAKVDEAGLRSIYEGFLRVGRSPLPTVAAVNGPAVGAGMNLALCCDVRVAGESARFDTRFLSIGLHPGGGHTWMLQRAVGPQAAAAMVLFGEVLDGPAAAARGLAWRCVPDDELTAAAMELALRAASVPRELSRRAKATLRAAPATHAEAVELELTAQLWSLTQRQC